LSLVLRTACFAALVAMVAGFKIPGHVAARKLAIIAALDQSR